MANQLALMSETKVAGAKPDSPMSEVKTLMTGISFGEQPRWHEGRLWLSDWGSREVVAVDLEGNSEVILRAQSFPCCVDWLPDGRLLLVSARDGLLLRREPDGTLVTHGDLSRVSKPPAGNELVVDGRCRFQFIVCGRDAHYWAPPLRSEHARFAHSAPTSGDDGEHRCAQRPVHGSSPCDTLQRR
jgi:hypothetical protein